MRRRDLVIIFILALIIALVAWAVLATGKSNAPEAALPRAAVGALHFQIRQDNMHPDPMPLLPMETRDRSKA